MKALLLHVPDENVVHAFKADRPGLASFRNVVRRVVDMLVTQTQRGAFLGPVHEPDLGSENHDACAFSAYQRFGNVEAALRKKLIEAIARDAARNVGIAGAYEFGISIAQGTQAQIDFSATTAGVHDLFELRVRGWTNAHTLAVIGKDVEFQNVVHRASCHDGVHAAGIIADHSAQIAVFMRGRIRAKGEIEFIGAITKLIQDAAGLYPGIFLSGIDLHNLVEVLGEIDDHGDVAGLSAEAGAAATRQQRRVVLACQSDGLNYVFNGLGNDDADRDLAIVRAIDGVESACAIVKADFTCDGCAQFGGQGIGLGAGFGGVPVWGRWSHA